MNERIWRFSDDGKTTGAKPRLMEWAYEWVKMKSYFNLRFLSSQAAITSYHYLDHSCNRDCIHTPIKVEYEAYHIVLIIDIFSTIYTTGHVTPPCL